MAAATSGKVNEHAAERRTRWGLPLAARKIFSVVTSPVTAEREPVSLLCREGFFFAHVLPFFLLGASGSFCIFYIYF